MVCIQRLSFVHDLVLVHIFYVAGVVVNVFRTELDVVEVELVMIGIKHTLETYPVLTLLEFLLGNDAAQILGVVTGIVTRVHTYCIIKRSAHIT